MAPFVLSDDAAFYTWVAITWALTAAAAVAMVRGWASGRRLRFEDVFVGPRAAAMLVNALLYQFSTRLLAVHMTIPEVRRLRGVRTRRSCSLRGALPERRGVVADPPCWREEEGSAATACGRCRAGGWSMIGSTSLPNRGRTGHSLEERSSSGRAHRREEVSPGGGARGRCSAHWAREQGHAVRMARA